MKLLIVKLHALGDLVIITPAIKRLRDGFPDAQIDLLTTDWSAPVVVSNPWLDDVFVESNGIFFDSGINTLIPTIKIVKKLCTKNYDAAVVFHSNFKIRVFAKALGVRNCFSFRPANNAGDFIKTSSDTVPLDEERHSALTAWELSDFSVRKLGGKPINPPELGALRYEWYIQDTEHTSAINALNGVSLSPGKFAVVMPGGGVNPNSREDVRRWDPSKFADLIVRVNKELNTPVVLLGGHSDIDVSQRVKSNIAAYFNQEGCDSGKAESVIDWTGEHNLRLAAAIMNEAKFVITNDTGPLHIAGALDVPTVGIFGPTGYRLKLPPGKHCFSANSDLPCSPCYFSSFKRCIFESIRCMEQLQVDDVMQVVRKALISSGQAVSNRISEELR